MKLHDLVQLHIRLGKVDHSPVLKELDNLIGIVGLLKVGVDDDYVLQIDKIVGLIDALTRDLDRAMGEIEYVRGMVSEDIVGASSKFNASNYESEMVNNDPNRIKEVRTLYIPNGVDEYVTGAIHLYTDWKYPGLEIGCRDNNMTKHLVACDPLYIVDEHQEFLDSTLSGQTPEYRAKLRPYLLKDADMSRLPQGQLGFAFSWNYFNYIPLSSIKRYLQEVHALLRPGGTFMFSYNNAELAAAAAYADSYFMSYVPKTQLIAACTETGFDVIGTTDFEPAVSWIELRKPGTLSSMKAHPVLGEIKFAGPR